jgi:HPt (histidine-containing phosphotransfer) domain-containing protein
MTVQAPLLDVDALVSDVDGDRDLLDELAGTFVAEVPDWIARLRAAVASGDADTVFRVAHGIGGAVAFFKAVAVHGAAVELEALGRGASLDGAAGLLARLEAGLQELRAFLDGAPWRR